MATKFGKVWGSTKPLIVTPTVEVHEISIKPGSYCSTHCHQYKLNSFYVIQGELEIHVEKNDYDLTDRTILHPGDFTSVPAGEYHYFKNNSERAVLALEIYHLEPLGVDIVRKNHGGLMETET